VQTSQLCLTSLASVATLSVSFLVFAAEPTPAKKPSAAAPLKFRTQQLRLDNNEGCAIADYNRDGKLDISAGEFWYAGPEFKDAKPVRKLTAFGKDYLSNNGEHAWDVNGDGWPDIISGTFLEGEVAWYENPKGEGHAKSETWRRHVLIDTKLGENEWTEFRDLNGDGSPEFIVNSWNESHPMACYQLTKNTAGEPALKPWIIHEGGKRTNGHGIGLGDLNGDGLADILFGNGWYERPKSDATTQPWTLHSDWQFPQASCPMLVVDLTGDGRNDIIWGHGHNYGLYWEEHRDDNRDGSTNWRHHLIDDRFSQPHVLAWEDIDNDGQPELITGRRVRAHSGGDPGDNDPGVIYYFKWNRESQRFTKLPVVENGPGIGLQIRIADLDGNGWKDIVCAGKSGTHILWNQAP